MGIPMLMYGVALNEAIASGNLSEMREMLAVSKFLRKTQASDLEDEQLSEWDEAQNQLISAIIQKESVKVAREDIIAIRDGLVVIDNISFARSLKTLLSSDSEGPYIKVTFGWD